ncbi:MAG: glycosyltransferase family 4 protein [Silvibacterium sp.]|nr:glycosyltransferase family 4 protein [Silvibacterium sp.]
MSAPREVVIDARWLRTGIGRYILTLLKNLKPKLPDTLLTCITMSAHAATLAPLCDRIIEMNCGIYSLAEQLRLPLAAEGASVFCAPHYNIPILRRGPMVVTIHDLTHLLFPEYRGTMRARIYANAMFRIASLRANRIITPSHYTRNCLIERLAADPAKISVVPCTVSGAFHQQPKEQAAEAVRILCGVDAPYILFVGSAAPHKNLVTLLKAHRLLYAKHRDAPHLVLVLPRKADSTGVDRELGSLLANQSVHCLHSISDESLAALYAAAVMTVMPSFEEGFGLPVIESMGCGTPVACSRAASLPEIAGDGAIYFDPHSAEEMVWAIDQLFTSQDLRRRLAERGIQRAASFSGTRAASAYAAILASVATDTTPATVPERQYGL